VRRRERARKREKEREGERRQRERAREGESEESEMTVTAVIAGQVKPIRTTAVRRTTVRARAREERVSEIHLKSS